MEIEGNVVNDDDGYSSSVSSVESDFSEVLNAWEAELDARETAARSATAVGGSASSSNSINNNRNGIRSSTLVWGSGPSGSGRPDTCFAANGPAAVSGGGASSSAAGPSTSSSPVGPSGPPGNREVGARNLSGEGPGTSGPAGSAAQAAAPEPSPAPAPAPVPSSSPSMSRAQSSRAPSIPRPPQLPPTQMQQQHQQQQQQHHESRRPPQRPLRRPHTAGPTLDAGATGSVGRGPAAASAVAAAAAQGPGGLVRRPASASVVAAGSAGRVGSGCGASSSTRGGPAASSSAVGVLGLRALGTGGAVAGGGAGGAAAAAAAGGRGALSRRAAFVAGSVNRSLRKSEGSSLPVRDIMLPRLPAAALAVVVPELNPVTRAALRCTCRTLRALVDEHTQSLTLRPDRRVAERLNRRHVKAFSLFPSLRHATVVLAGSCSGPQGPSPAALAAMAPSAVQATAGAATAAGGGPAGMQASAVTAARAQGRTAGGTAAGGAGGLRRPATATAAAASPPSPLLPLSGWLVLCGTAPCMTSLTLHVGEVALLEDLALSVTHPRLQRLELFLGRTGSPHATPPVVQFMLGPLSGLSHLRIVWAGGPPYFGGAGAPGGGGGGGPGATVHGARRLFLDGRPRLGSLLLGALADLKRLESLEIQGFLIDTDGHAVLARHWPTLAGRLRRLVLSGLHLMVPTSTPPGEQLGELMGSCTRLHELHADLCLPAAPGVPGAAAAAAGPGGAAAMALLISLMYASRDVRAVRPEFLPASLTRLALPGVCLTAVEDLLPLSRLRALTCLEVMAVGPGAAEHLPALKELRLMDCCWRQVLDMLPWKPPQRQTAQQQQPSAATALAAIDGAPQQVSSVPALAWGPPELEPSASAAAVAANAPGRDPAGPQRAGNGEGREGYGANVAGSGSRTGMALDEAGAGAGEEREAGAGAGEAREAGAAGGATPVSIEQGPGRVHGRESSGDRLELLEVLVCERLDDWHSPDRALLARVAKGLLPLVDSGCRIRLKVSKDAQPHIWNESDEDGKPWEPAAVWRHIKAAQNLRRLQAETKAVAERLARGRLLQAARRKDKERPFVDR